MATHGWRTSRSIIDNLKQDASGFNFYQAVRLLECLNHDSKLDLSFEASSQENIIIIDNAVQFKADVRDDFSPSPITSITFSRNKRGGKPIMLLARFGLAGRLGPLPQPYSTWLQNNLAKGERAMSDFFDIFNHRLAALLYLAKKKYRLGLNHQPLDRSPPTRYVNSLFGFGTPHLENRLPVEHRQLVAFAGLLANSRSSLPSFKNCLSHFLKARLEIDQLQGEWLTLEQDQHTYLGVSGGNQSLGHETVLGTRCWDQQASITLRIGPLSINRVLSFLPIYGESFEQLAALVDFLSEKRWNARIVLLINKHDIPFSKLDERTPLILGRSAWLKSHPSFATDDEIDAQVNFTLKAT